MNTMICYLNEWKRFVQEGVLDSARLNKRITESWYRCKKEQVNPFLNKGVHILTPEQLTLQKEKNSVLMEIAIPNLERINKMISESGMMTLLVDPHGYVLSISGNKNTLQEARKINFVEGVRWTEGEVGTNAIGTALQTKEAVMINGTEHYSIASHKWSCSATPILNNKGKLLGVIDVSCPVDHAHPFMLGTVTSIAYAMEKEFRIRSYKREIALAQRAVELADMYRDRLFVVCNQQQTIISASKRVREKFPQANELKLDTLYSYGYRIEIETPILSKEDNEMIGKCLFLSEVVYRKQKSSYAASSASKPFWFEGARGTSESFRQTLKQVKLVAGADATVYISGETGSGKELIARAIHENSSRKNGPFISLNCGAIPKELMESELFGYVEGAFTGAKRRGYKGKFEQANYGTIFLDEIGEIPSAMQVALLRVLQERKVVPIGGTKEIPLDIRIITATHRDLEELVNEGIFRKDLFYRLHVYPIKVPPLRERKEDIPDLIQYFCEKYSWDIPFTVEICMKLKDYQWPGNIRELMNVLERMYIMHLDELDGDELFKAISPLESKLPASLLAPGQDELEVSELPLKTREKIQRDLMLDALQKTKGNVTAAAKLLEVPRSTFYKRLQKFGL